MPEYYCESCDEYHEDEYESDEYESDSHGIYSYDYKPQPIWFGGEGAAYYLGFELEISASAYDTTPIYEWARANGHSDMLYCKEDGSVNGFEIVSHPMTPEFFDSVNWPRFFGMLETHYPMNGRSEPEGHGLHVHVSRTAFPRMSTLARWSYMVNRYQEHTERVARRCNSSWSMFTPYPVSVCLPYEGNNSRPQGRWVTDRESPLPCGCCYPREWVADVLTNDRLRRQYQARVYPARYMAVNLTNGPTVEMRAFRSTRVPEEFVSSIHYVIATVDFVREMQLSHATVRDALAWETFRDYIAAHPVFAPEIEVLTGRKPPEGRYGPAEIRAWARENGYRVASYGPIPNEIHDAFTLAI